MIELSEFRARRDYFQWLRRVETLPLLKTQETALKHDLEALYKKRDRAPKRDKQLIESTMHPLQWEYQFVVGQIAVIESEHEALTARVPKAWRAEVFTIAAETVSEKAESERRIA